MNEKKSKEPKGFPKLLSPIQQDESLLHLNDSIHNSSLISLIPCRDDNFNSRQQGPSYLNEMEDTHNNNPHTPEYQMDFHHPNYFDNGHPQVGRETMPDGKGKESKK